MTLKHGDGLYLHLTANGSAVDRPAERRDPEWLEAGKRANAEHAEQVAINALSGALRRVAAATDNLANALQCRLSTHAERATLARAIENLWETREEHARAINDVMQRRG